jgi:hypothetical protein
MYMQPTQGPTVPPIIAHIYFAKLAKPSITRTPSHGILAELAELRRP